MEADEVEVEVVYAAAPHRVVMRALRLPAGATVADALRASGLVDVLSAEDLAPLEPGIWGRAVPGDTRLRDGDRVELTRPLTVDPKEARRLRYRRDGLKRKRRSR
jgi:hypothetical protein